MSGKREQRTSSVAAALGATALFTLCLFVGNVAGHVYVDYLKRKRFEEFLQQEMKDSLENPNKSTDCSDNPNNTLTTKNPKDAERKKPRNFADQLRSIEKKLGKRTGSLLMSLDGQGNLGTVTRLQNILQKLGRTANEPLQLTRDEERMAQDIIDPGEMESGFGDIGGLDNLKREIWELVVLPILKPEVFDGTSSKLIRRRSGILLYGKPGCGKTLLAKAIAKESGAVFIPIELSRLLSSLWGESEKLVAATFSLARKVAPSVIFFDEMDSVCQQSSLSQNSSRLLDCVKKCFLTSLDGVSTEANQASVMVFGATNHPQVIDKAILRRFPLAFNVPLPDREGREAILRSLLTGQAMDDAATAFIPKLAKDLTESYSGSDLKELCCAAAREPIREAFADISKHAVLGRQEGKDSADETAPTIRALTEKDFLVALEKVKSTGKAAEQYGEGEHSPSSELRNSLYI